MNCEGCKSLIKDFDAGDGEMIDYCIRAERYITGGMKCPGKVKR